MARKILKLEEISQQTGIPLATLRFMRHRGDDIPLWKLAGRIVAYSDEIDAWVETQRNASIKTAV